MSRRSLNWLKFGGLVGLAFFLGLLFAGLLDIPRASLAQSASRASATIADVKAPPIPQAKMLADISDAFAAVAEAVRPSVVFIKSTKTEKTTLRRAPRNLPPGMEQFFGPGFRMPQGPQTGSGTGFIVSPDGYILTNNHVVEGADKVEVELLDKRKFLAKVVGTDPNTDVAVLRIPATGLKPAALGNSDNERIGEWVLAVGNPLGEGLTFTVTQGIISAKGRRLPGLERPGLGISDFIQTDAAINPGNSGGPLVNVRGEVIGINSAIASETGSYSGYAFAIPINLARNVMNMLVADGKVHRAAIGVSINDAGIKDAKYVGLNEIRGVVVMDFTGDDSPARKAGLEVGDVILSIDGKPIDRTGQLQQEIGFRRPGEAVRVEVARKGGQRKTFSVPLKALDEAQVAQRGDSSDDTREDASAKGAGMTRLGIAVEPITPAIARDKGVRVPADINGLIIDEVTPDGPAADVLGAGDVILSVEGKPVTTEAELRAAIKGLPAGSVVTFRVFSLQTQQRRIARVELGAE